MKQVKSYLIRRYSSNITIFVNDSNENCGETLWFDLFKDRGRVTKAVVKNHLNELGFLFNYELYNRVAN